MTLTKSQVAQLVKWAKAGRLIIRPITGEELPEWAKQEFILARSVVGMLAVGHSQILEKLEGARVRKIRVCAERNKKAWATRKRQKLAREAAKAEERTEAA